MRYIHTSSFFNYIRYSFGDYSLGLLKDWMKYKRLFYKNKLRRIFCKFCIDNNIVPPHLLRLHNVNVSVQHDYSKRKFNNLIETYTRKVLRLELDDTYRCINFAQTTLYKLERLIGRYLPGTVTNAFFSRQNKGNFYFFKNELKKLNKKMDWLKSKKIKSEFLKVEQINYTWTHSDFSSTNKHFSFNIASRGEHHSSASSEIVSLHPGSFKDLILAPSVTSLRKKWFLNLSGTSIPDNVQQLIQLGENFALPGYDRNKIKSEFIKSIEANIQKFPIPTHDFIRKKSIPILKELSLFSTNNDPINKRINTLKTQTINFLKTHNNILLTRADKGNITVALDRDNYIHSVEKMLQDDNYYERAKKDPTKSVIVSLRKLLTKWKNLEYIPTNIHRKLICSDGLLPRAYGLPKVHKLNCPYRIIVSSVDSPLYPLATFLQNIISTSIPTARSHIDNSFDLVKKLTNTYINDGFSLISLDVISLFTNIPIELALRGVVNRWNYISLGCSVPMDEFLEAIRLILESTYFSFNDNIYKQKFGTPMGSPLSPIIADLVMQDLEEGVFETFDFDIPFYYRYVDDLVMAVPTCKIDWVVNAFNSVHPKIQFTVEIGHNRINFLDTTIINRNKKIIFDWFHKPTFSGRYLNFLSQHPLSQKKGTITGLVDRAFFLSHPEFHQKNLIFIVKVLLQNDYPLDLIFNTMTSRIKYLINGKKILHNNNNEINEDNKKIWFTVPYISGISDKFKNIINGEMTRVSFFSENKLSRFIKAHKDALQKVSNMNTVYKIDCKDCDASYVGQTGRQLKTRISEHKNHINRKTSSLSVITEHRLHHGHDFEWENVRVLDVERNYKKRLISEMINIKEQKNGINLQTDTESLDRAYFSCFNWV